MNTANYWIEKLELIKHPEGGYFKEVYRSDENIKETALPDRYQGKRSFSTSIYFLLNGDEFSNLHRIQSDETWHFYVGSTLELYVLSEDGRLVIHLLGRDLENGEHLQVTIPRNCWFGGKVKEPESYALLGCTVAPGFHFDDFELGDRNSLISLFPDHKEIIKELTAE